LIAPQPNGGVQAILKGEAIQASLIKAESRACGRPRYKHAPYVYVYVRDASVAACHFIPHRAPTLGIVTLQVSYRSAKQGCGWLSLGIRHFRAVVLWLYLISLASRSVVGRCCACVQRERERECILLCDQGCVIVDSKCKGDE